jgi:predicted N-acyltransferase
VRTRIMRSLGELGLDRWDSTGPAGNFYRSGTWLATIEGTLEGDGFPEAAFVVVEDESGMPLAGLAAYLVSDAVRFPFSNPPRLLAPEHTAEELAPFQTDEERRRSDDLARLLEPLLAAGYPSAICAVPYALTLSVRSRDLTDDVAEQLVEAFEDVASDWRARSRAVLYVPQVGREALAAVLERRGYARGLLGARCVMPLRWQTFDEYLADLTADRRNMVRRDIRAFEASSLRLQIDDGDALGGLADELGYLSAKLLEKYGFGFDLERERLSYQRMYMHARAQTKVLTVRDGERMVAFAIFHECDGGLFGGMTGQDYEHPKVHFHANYHAPLMYALERGYTAIERGVGSYNMKISRGFDPYPLDGFFDFGDQARDPLHELLAVRSAAQQRHLDSYARPWRAQAQPASEEIGLLC